MKGRTQKAPLSEPPTVVHTEVGLPELPVLTTLMVCPPPIPPQFLGPLILFSSCRREIPLDLSQHLELLARLLLRFPLLFSQVQCEQAGVPWHFF